VWNTRIDGTPLHFRLAGINNQNFIMRDEETGTWWQQVTGLAISGPLAGRTLEPVLFDDISFDVWRSEHPHPPVLVPDDSAPWRAFSENWEAETAQMPIPTIARLDGTQPFEGRQVVIGLKVNNQAKAYALDRVIASAPVVDEVAGVPVVLLVAPDGRSIRAFDRTVDGSPLELFKLDEGGESRIVDATSRSTWDFSGKSTAGPLAGRELRRIQHLEDYWFDWKNYNPDTHVGP